MRTVQVDDYGIATTWPGGQSEFAADWKHMYVALEGGWGSGKTYIGARKLLTLHVQNAFDFLGRATYVPSAVVGPTYRNTLDVDLPEIEKACEEAGLLYEYKAEAKMLVLPELGTRANKSVIYIRSAERPDLIAGWQVGAAWGDEVARWKEDKHNPRNDPLLQLTGRVRHPRAQYKQLLFTYTNEGDTTRVYNWMRSGSNKALYRAATKDNPVVASFYEEQRRQLTPELVTQYLEGGAISLKGGRVYVAFDRASNVDSSVAATPGLPLHLSLDFNIAPGMHAEIGQWFPDKDMFTVVDEIYAPRLDVRGVISRFATWIENNGGWQWPELHIFGDATGQSGWAGTGESCYQILMQGLRQMWQRIGKEPKVRLRVPKSNPFVEDRINAVNVALKDLTGAVHYKCSDKCKRLIADFENLKRDENGEIDKSERKLSHASDAEGYRVELIRPTRIIRRQEAPGRFLV